MSGLLSHLETVYDRYGWEVAAPPEVLRGGYVAYVHRIRTRDGLSFFTKTYDDARPISAMLLPTLDAITTATRALAAQDGIGGRVVAPLHGPIVRSGRYTTVVFPFIDGVTPRETPLTDAQLTQLVESVARIHACDVTTPDFGAVPREDFTASWFDAIAPALARVDQPGHALHAVFAGRAPHIAAVYTRFRAVAQRLAGQQHAMVLCHTDIHGYNVVLSADIPLLIDWEGMKIAPKEHDLMFWVADARWELIWQTYQRFHPAAHIDADLLEYYGTRRLFEDLIQDIERVEHEHPMGQELQDLCEQIAYACTELAAKPH